ncbi:MAG: N-acetylneuraminate synthase [bacterium]|nr:N-acetylneuraminate synthase [bacterium]
MPAKKTIKISKKTIGQGCPVFVIAEAGVNHNGRLSTALRLVDAAANAGADAVKFQTFKAEQVVTRQGKMAKYQKKNIGKMESQIKMLKKLELPEGFYKPIIRRCKQKKIIFLSTPHGGFESVDFLQSLNAPAFKFGSGDLTNLPLLKYSAKFGKPMILGTGMATLQEVKEAVGCVKKAGNDKIIVLHCATNYPCPLGEANLSAMRTMADKFGVLTGYSDHTLGAQAPVVAAALGARVIEKHFTLDKKMAGPDHSASAEPDELREIIRQIRDVKIILGSSAKKPNPSERETIKIARKSVVTVRDIKKGEKFTEKNIEIKRPGTGIQPKFYPQILGKTAKTNIGADTLIKKEYYL